MRRQLLLVLLFLLPLARLQGIDCQAAGTIQRGTFHSAALPQSMDYRVYLPPCYHDDSQRYPTLTLLHGSDADDRQWAELGFLQELEGAIQRAAAPPMLVLMPAGGALANDNSIGKGSYDKLLRAFIGQMQAQYRSDARQAIGGISRGGFWAFQLGLSDPNAFVAIGGHSPYFDENHVPPAFNPLHLATSLPADSAPKIWLDRGSSDYAANGVDQMHINLLEADVRHDYQIYPGGQHDARSWRRNMPDYVAFYASALQPIDPAPPKSPQALELWLPVVGFGTPRVSIRSSELQAALQGQFDQQLLLSEIAANRLQQRGYNFHAQTRILPHAKLFRELWRNKRSYSLVPFNELHLRLRPLWMDDMPIVDQLPRYPLVFAGERGNFQRERLKRITISGTTALARHTLPAVDALGIEAAVSGIRDYVRRADYFHITNEASIVPGCPSPEQRGLAGSELSLCMKAEHTELFARLGIDIVDLTGNHINDFSTQPLLDSLNYYAAAGIATVGGGRTLAEARAPLLLEQPAGRVGWLACNAVGPTFALVNENGSDRYGQRAGAAFCERAWLRDALAQLQQEVDVVLLTVQFQEFERFQPHARLESAFKTYADWGADIVIGTAEHKPMTVEFYPTQRGDTAFLHYGLGNLYFDQLGWSRQRFFLDTLYLYEGQVRTVEIFPGIIENRARPRLLTGEDRFNFLHFMLVQKNGL